MTKLQVPTRSLRQPGNQDQPDPSCAGLSILELLVSLVLLVAITSGLVASLGLGVRILERSRGMDQSLESLALRTKLRTWLAAATPPMLLDGESVMLVGTPARLTFATTAPVLFVPSTAFQQVGIDLTDDRIDLVVTALDTDGTAVQRAQTQLTGLGGSLRFDYHGGAGTTWTPSWDNPDRLPVAVRIRSEDNNLPSSSWPDLTVRLLLR